MSVLRMCQCYTDTAGAHLCDLHKAGHVHVWESRATTGGYIYVCVLCSEVRNTIDTTPPRV